jgi:phosphate transport system substrate-binding protein
MVLPFCQAIYKLYHITRVRLASHLPDTDLGWRNTLTLKSICCHLLLGIGMLLMHTVALSNAAQAETVIKIGGTGCALGTMKLLVAAYEKAHPGIKIRILPSLGSTGGIKAALNNEIDLALSSRPLTETERHQGAKESEYARSPFVFVTHARVNKKNITIRELEEIYGNTTSNWSDGNRIRLILRPEKDMDTRIIRAMSPGMEPAMKRAQARHGMIVAITDQESSTAIANTTGSLGGTTLTEIISENVPVNILAFNGVQPTVKSITDGSYRLSKSLYLVTTGKKNAEIRRFTDFIHSAAAGNILVTNGNLPVATK